MIAKYLNIDCNRHCERLVAYTYLIDPKNTMAIASRIKGSSLFAAAKLAKAMLELDPEHARLLAQKTVSQTRGK